MQGWHRSSNSVLVISDMHNEQMGVYWFWQATYLCLDNVLKTLIPGLM